MIKVIISDTDNTLAKSRQPISENTANLIAKILEKKYFCIISGGDEELLRRQFEPLFKKDFNEKNFLISATSGAALFTIEDKELNLVYKNYLTKQEKEKIEKIIHALVNEFWLRPASKDAGPLIEDRKSQITLSCLGHQASLTLKEKWDPDGRIRTIMIKWIYSDKKREILDTEGISIKIGGTTSIDFTKIGVDKQFGIKKILEHLKLTPNEAIFFGDKTQEGGNDYIEDYVETIQTNMVEMKNHLQKIGEEL